jgi:hypothetical protein
VFKTVTRQVVDTPASVREIDVPAVYRTVSREVVDTPASTRDVEVPAVFRTVTRQVVDVPASTREIDVPAEYRTVKVAKLVEEAKEITTDVPAQFQTISKTVKVADARSEYRSVLCDTNATPSKIREIQTALQKAGFYSGAIDGVIKRSTMSAVNAFQQSKNLPTDNYINLDTVKALGVSPI